jgi:hypothetical protein
MALIYQIKCDTTQQSYIGSTKMSLERRMYAHEHLCIQWKNGRANFCSSYPLIEANNYKTSILEHCTLEDKRDRESHWVKITENCVNRNIPNRSMKQWYQDNKIRWKAHMKEYYHKVKKPKRRLEAPPTPMKLEVSKEENLKRG